MSQVDIQPYKDIVEKYLIPFPQPRHTRPQIFSLHEILSSEKYRCNIDEKLRQEWNFGQNTYIKFYINLYVHYCRKIHIYLTKQKNI